MLMLVLVVSIVCLVATLVALSYVISVSAKMDHLLRRVVEIEGYLAINSGPHTNT